MNTTKIKPSAVEIVKACDGKCTVIVDGTGKGATVAQSVGK